MPTQSDRDFFRNQKVRLENAKNAGDTETYHRIYNEMLRRGNQVVAELSWYSWGQEEAYDMLRSVLAIPPYLGHPTQIQVAQDLAVHREIGKNLQGQTASLETTMTVLEIVKGVGEAAQLALQVVGIGSAVLAVEQLVQRYGAKKAAEFLAEEFIKNQIKEELQGQAIDALADALKVDKNTAHQIADLAGFVNQLKTATKERRAKEAQAGKTGKPDRARTRPPAKAEPELAALGSTISGLQDDQKWLSHEIMAGNPSPSPKIRPLKIRASTKKALGPLQSGQERRHFLPGAYMRHTLEAALTDENWQRFAQRLKYDPSKFKDRQQFQRKWEQDLYNEANNIWKGSATGNPRGQTGEARVDWGIWKEKRADILQKVLTEQNWKDFARRAGYDPVKFKDFHEFQAQWEGDWEKQLVTKYAIPDVAWHHSTRHP